MSDLYKLTNGKIAEVESAQNLKCMLLSSGSNGFFIRVQGKGNVFEDFDIAHCDMNIMIIDTLASIYREKHRLYDKKWIDHSPDVLGLKMLAYS